MYLRKAGVLVAFASALFSVTFVSSAQDAGFYLGGSVGRADTNNDAASVAALGVTVLSNDERDTGWKMFGGYQFNKNWGIEASYVDLGNFGLTGSVGGTPAFASAKVHGYSLAGVGTLPVTESFSLFAKLGIVYSKIKSSAAVGAVFASASENQTDWTAGIGVKYNVNKNFAFRAEAERFEAGGSGNANLYSVGVQIKF